MPRSIERLAGNPDLVSAALEISTVRPIDAPVRYRASSSMGYQLQTRLPAAQQQRWLQLPAGFNPRSLAWARQWRGSGATQLTSEAALEAVLTHLRSGSFRYTLQPPLLGRDGVDDFLFRTQAGFYEHYAGNFTVLMRAKGTPARVLTGYQGGERHADGSLPLRQSDALAAARLLSPASIALLCALLAAPAAVAGWLIQRKHAASGDTLDTSYAQFCRLQARRGCSRAPHEGPHSYAARLASTTARPEVHAAMARFLAIYAAMKYGNASLDEQTRAQLTLRRLLTQCR